MSRLNHNPRSRRSSQRRCISLITAVALTASLIIGCRVRVQPPLMTPSISDPIVATPSAALPELPTVLVPAGNCTIGSNESEDTQPVHQVFVNAFQIDRYEVTNAQYAEFLNSLNIQPLQNTAAGDIRSNDLPEAAVSLLTEGPEGSQRNPLIALDDEHARIAIQDGKFVPQPGYENHPVTETTWRGANEFCK